MKWQQGITTTWQHVFALNTTMLYCCQIKAISNVCRVSNSSVMLVWLASMLLAVAANFNKLDKLELFIKPGI